MAARHHSYLAQLPLISVYPIVIVATVLHPQSSMTKLMEMRPVRFLGRISYSLYLWQQLFSNGETIPSAHSLYSHVALCWCCTFACASASYYLIEAPLIRRGHAIAKRFDLQPPQIEASEAAR
jgi:peptidoglycan/LPS O-acetylase OafA/YrhL